MDDSINMNESGTVKISSDVVTVIASLAAVDIDGIASMSGGITTDIAQKLGVKSSNKGVKVQIAEDKAIIDLFVVIKYGYRIPEVAAEAQESVKTAVETMTGLTVEEVNIHIQGISIPKPTASDEPVQQKK